LQRKKLRIKNNRELSWSTVLCIKIYTCVVCNIFSGLLVFVNGFAHVAYIQYLEIEVIASTCRHIVKHLDQAWLFYLGWCFIFLTFGLECVCIYINLKLYNLNFKHNIKYLNIILKFKHFYLVIIRLLDCAILQVGSIF